MPFFDFLAEKITCSPDYDASLPTAEQFPRVGSTGCEMRNNWTWLKPDDGKVTEIVPERIFPIKPRTARLPRDSRRPMFY
jgi:hypothetical protein